MFLKAGEVVLNENCFPRASGGVSGTLGVHGVIRPVFPARAGVFPKLGVPVELIRGFPRASGGVSTARWRLSLGKKFSPRERGCFRLRLKP